MTREAAHGQSENGANNQPWSVQQTMYDRSERCWRRGGPQQRNECGRDEQRWRGESQWRDEPKWNDDGRHDERRGYDDRRRRDYYDRRDDRSHNLRQHL